MYKPSLSGQGQSNEAECLIVYIFYQIYKMMFVMIVSVYIYHTLFEICNGNRNRKEAYSLRFRKKNVGSK